jgi:5,10-methylenetetrahydromethanopterin reductase
MRFGVIYQSFDPPPIFLQYVRLIEDAGFDYLWVCDSSLHARDVFGYLTLAAVNTTRLRLGVSVHQPYTRHPAINVNGMATVNEISGGRAIMAVGTGDRPQRELGFQPASVKLVRDMIHVSRQLIAGETVTFTNEQFSLREARVRYDGGLEMPIYVACSGPKMLSLAGEVADGVLMLCGSTPETIALARTNVAEGAARAGRSIADLDVAWGAATVIDDNTAVALDQTRLMAAWYANHSARYATAAGLGSGVLQAMRGKDPGTNLHEARAAATLASDDVVDRLALAGSAAHVRERLAAARALGIEHFELFLMGPQKRQTLERFAAEVMPALR